MSILDLMIVDLQGNLRGKRVPAALRNKVLQGGGCHSLHSYLIFGVTIVITLPIKQFRKAIQMEFVCPS